MPELIAEGGAVSSYVLCEASKAAAAHGGSTLSLVVMFKACSALQTERRLWVE
jgi:hypothetical protein